jgi:hypothetical protein
MMVGKITGILLMIGLWAYAQCSLRVRRINNRQDNAGVQTLFDGEK